jgi:hypothetical protein
MNEKLLETKVRELETILERWAKENEAIGPNQHVSLTHEVTNDPDTLEIRVKNAGGVFVWRPLTDKDWEKILSPTFFPISRRILELLREKENKPILTSEIRASVGSDGDRDVEDWTVFNDINSKLLKAELSQRVVIVYIDERNVVYSVHSRSVRERNIPKSFVILTKT